MRLNNNFPFYENTALLLILAVNLINLILQLIIKDYEISAFTNFNRAVFTPVITPLYILSFCSLLFGYLLSTEINGNSKKNIYFSIDLKKLEIIVKFVLFALFVEIFLIYFYLGRANLFYLWTGRANALDVELALRSSPFGIHGVGLILSYMSIILWSIYLNSSFKPMPFKANLLIMGAILILISQGKVQGFLYVIAAYIMKFDSFSTLKRKLAYLLFFFFLLFIATRYLRNQSTVDFSFLSAIQFVTMNYMGSPFMNTSYLIQNYNSLDFSWEFFRHLAPQKVLPAGDLIHQLPDITSPLGLFGNGFLLGGPTHLSIYLFFIGFFVHFLSVKSKKDLSFQLFYPFLLVASSFSFLYDHFSNLMFFWIPFAICYMISRYILVPQEID